MDLGSQLSWKRSTLATQYTVYFKSRHIKLNFYFSLALPDNFTSPELRVYQAFKVRPVSLASLVSAAGF